MSDLLYILKSHIVLIFLLKNKGVAANCQKVICQNPFLSNNNCQNVQSQNAICQPIHIVKNILKN